MRSKARSTRCARASSSRFPTETVYGLGADAANAEAVRRLFAVKGRPADHPVIVHVARAAQLDDLARDVPDGARLLADAFWPGPLTIVVRRNPDLVVAEVTGGLDTVGVRVPDHPVALELLEAFGGGVAAPSANRFGRVSPTTAAHVRADLGDDVRQILDGGPSRVGVESTIVDVTGSEPAILRVGGLSRADVARVIGGEVALRTSGEAPAPGTLRLALRAGCEGGDRCGARGRHPCRATFSATVDASGCSRCRSRRSRRSTVLSCWIHRMTSRNTPGCSTPACARPTSSDST